MNVATSPSLTLRADKAEKHSELEVALNDPADHAPEVLSHDSPELNRDKEDWEGPVCIYYCFCSIKCVSTEVTADLAIAFLFHWKRRLNTLTARLQE